VGAVDDKVAGLVVVLAVEQRIDGDQPAIRRELDQPASALLGAVELAARAMREAVHAVGVTAKLGDRTGRRIEAQEASLVDDAEEDGAVVPHDAADRPFIRTRHELELPCHDVRTPSRPGCRESSVVCGRRNGRS
jgi:hypothetical protein